MTHSGYILSAYLAAFVSFSLLLIRTLINYRSTKKELKRVSLLVKKDSLRK